MGHGKRGLMMQHSENITQPRRVLKQLNGKEGERPNKYFDKWNI